MQKIIAQPRLKGNLAELFLGYTNISERVGQIEAALRKEDRDGEYRVIAADTGQELFFKNQDMVLRFTSMTKPLQQELIEAIRAAMDMEKVEVIEIEIPWTATKTKTLTVTKINQDGCLNLYI